MHTGGSTVEINTEVDSNEVTEVEYRPYAMPSIGMFRFVMPAFAYPCVTCSVFEPLNSGPRNVAS